MLSASVRMLNPELSAHLRQTGEGSSDLRLESYDFGDRSS